MNGNAGSAGFAIDNIRIEEFTFEDDGTYTVDVNGMDASERQIVTIANHDFKSGMIVLMLRHYLTTQIH